MRFIAIILLTSLLAFSLANAAVGEYQTYSKSHKHYRYHGNVYTDFDDGTVIIYHDGRDNDRIEITEDYELYINGLYIEIGKEQQELLSEYYNQTMELAEYAEQVGLKSAEISTSGVEFGFIVVEGVYKLIFSDHYEHDDLKREIEEKAEDLEVEAEELEIEAEKLEEIADQLEELIEELKDQIPELAELDWF